ncbi:MAG: (E)-4-hydroxy-3-methylbut-2-enyl-diphosphate synthase [Bacteroidales bacterium]|jgi:(E)-4-hydroxy-3-methylbut-2-enyl-diphosphate synthase|nr:(E)-4-hydroxy-3-methylbut-2-enyl-diphosphate synthase [Bacteroidales bacterium]
MKISAPYTSSVVRIGSLDLGGANPVRLQSMTNTDTLDTASSVAQCIRIIEAGADLVRLTAQGPREAANLAEIKKELRRAGFETPLVADIHFNPQAAETAARIVEKVRINPGNYADRRAAFAQQEFSDAEYAAELERIHERLLPLIRICYENGTAIRLGVNHGSLSDRIMTRYGNTPAGMVQSAIEFISIFRAENFTRLVLSMKSSDTAVMIEATRMLVARMIDEGMAYPLHLGVTEAGEGEDGRVRSAAGIGALLAEGIGDTIRVSLSEDPEKEIPVARTIAEFYSRDVADRRPLPPAAYRVPVEKPVVLRKVHGPLVVANMTPLDELSSLDLSNAGFALDMGSGKMVATDGSADIIMAQSRPPGLPESSFVAVPYRKWLDRSDSDTVFPLFSPETWHESRKRSEKLNLLLTGPHFNIEYLREPDPASTLLLFTFDPERDRYAPDIFMKSLEDNGLSFSIVLNPVFRIDDLAELQVKAAALLGRYLVSGMAAGISLANTGSVKFSDLTSTAFSILQCTATRITRTMYLSCPTCGRTKFNLQDAVRKVKEATGHLKGLKIAVMGCVVNGPGEMAGADYGYVGAAPGKVHIYRGTVPVLKNVPEEEAVSELLRLIENDRP